MAGTYVPSGLQAEPPAALRARVEAALGEPWRRWSKPNTGLSAAHRFVVELASGRSVFVKAATDAQTAAWLRNEHLALRTAPAELTPAIIAWIDDRDDRPILLTEALIDAYWPTSTGVTLWRDGDLDRVCAAVDRLSRMAAPAGLPIVTFEPTTGWRDILAAPDGFFGLKLCSTDWLAAHGEALAEAEASLDRSGESFVHGDMRSDNICLTADGVKFVDWSNACRGATDTDLAIFLPAAHLEGGSAPYDVLPDAAPWASAGAATLARRAANDTAAPDWLRRVFRRLARINLDWAIASLELPPRDG